MYSTEGVEKYFLEPVVNFEMGGSGAEDREANMWKTHSITRVSSLKLGEGGAAAEEGETNT